MKFIFFTVFSTVTFVTLAQGQEWIPWKASQGVPKFAVPGGHEADYRPLYTVRAVVGDELAPGKYVAEDGKAYIPYKGREYQYTEFEFLTATNVKWVPAANGVTPPNAVVGGNIRGTETMYIGRVHYKNTITQGKIVPKDGVLYIPFAQGEYKFSEYEQLVYV